MDGFLDSLVGKLISKQKGEIDASEITAPIVLLYFSAFYCEPCVEFTPKLVEAYNAWNKNEKQVEIIFVSRDNYEKEWEMYYTKMPWLAIPYGDDRISQYKLAFDVIKIPTLILIDRDGNVLNREVRNLVATHGEKALERLKEY